MPKAMRNMWVAIGAQEALGDIANQDVTQAGRWGQLPAGITVTKGASLFPRLMDPETENS